MARIDLDLDEMLEGMTRDGMKRFVKKLLSANDTEEKRMLRTAEKNDLADLDEEMHGKPNTPKVEENDDAFDLEAKGEDDGEDTDAAPKKKGRK